MSGHYGALLGSNEKVFPEVYDHKIRFQNFKNSGVRGAVFPKRASFRPPLLNRYMRTATLICLFEHFFAWFLARLVVFIAWNMLVEFKMALN
jgi:hypothetical protein